MMYAGMIYGRILAENLQEMENLEEVPFLCKWQASWGIRNA